VIKWLKELSDGAKAVLFLGGLLVAAISGAFALKSYLNEFQTLPSKVVALEAEIAKLKSETAILADKLTTLDDQAVRYGNGVGLKVSYESTIYQLDACISCPEGQRTASFRKDSETQHQVYLTKEP
jgi:hypothetical protein